MANDAAKLLYDTLEAVAKEQGYDNFTTSVHEFSTDGANYTSRLFHVTLSAPQHDDLKLFAKVACLGEKMRSKFPADLYNNEIFFYTNILKRIQGLEESSGLETKYRLSAIKCYGYSGEYLKETLVLEDLSSRGFTTLDKLQCVDWKYASRAVSELAKFHALTVAFRYNHSEEFNNLKDRFPVIFNKNLLKDFFDNNASKNIAAIKEENRQRFLDFLKTEDFDFSSKAMRCPVLTHGDFRPSNIMHRENENGELDIVIVDYQGFQLSSPLMDLMYFIMMSTDGEFRARHYRQLLDHFYSELSGALRRLHVDPETVYSNEDYELEVKVFQRYAVTMGTLVLPAISGFVENARSIEESDDANVFVVEPCELGTRRLNDLIDDFIKLGVL